MAKLDGIFCFSVSDKGGAFIPYFTGDSFLELKGLHLYGQDLRYGYACAHFISAFMFSMGIKSLIMTYNIITCCWNLLRMHASYVFIICPHRQKFSMTIVLLANDSKGVIFYNGQKMDGKGDFISLSLNDGILEFRYDLGKGPAVIR